MKRIALIAALFVGLTVNAQDHIEEITKNSCSCIGKLENGLTSEELTMKMGLCIISEAQPYAKQLKSKNGIDMSDLTNENDNMTKLGQLIGLKMASVCPDVLMQISGASEETEPNRNGESNKSVFGTIKKVEKEQFLILYLEEDGKSEKYLWLERFPNSDKVELEMDNLLNRKAEILFESKDIYDARVNQYITYKVIRDMYIR